MAPKCPLNNKLAYDDWYIGQFKEAQQQQQQHHQQNDNKTDAEKIKEKVHNNVEKGWCTFQADEFCGLCESESGPQQQSDVNNRMRLNQFPSDKFNFLKDSFILDTGSTCWVELLFIVKSD